MLAVIVDEADPGDPGNLRRQEVLDIFVDLGNRQVGRHHGDRHQLCIGRIDFLIGRRVRQVLGQQPACRVDGRLNVLGRAIDFA